MLFIIQLVVSEDGDHLVSIILRQDESMQFVIVGPCSVGKSTVSSSLSKQANLTYLDFDALGIADMGKRKGQTSPFSVSALNLRQSIPLILSTSTMDFVLDIGGNTVFRKNVDNSERLNQVYWLKTTYLATVVVLTASRDILKGRFISTRKRNWDEFEEIWNNWLDIAQQYWQQCGDIFIDTSFLSVPDVIGKIEASLARKGGLL